MPTIDWLKQEFDYGYDSGDVLAETPGKVRATEESRIGGCYRTVFTKAVLPHMREDSTVLEIGPGGGSWSRALLTHLPKGTLHTADFQDVTPWLKPEEYNGRLICTQVTDNSLREFENSMFDFIWSFGVLCHCNTDLIAQVLKASFARAASGATAVHQYADWEKLDALGWPQSRHIPAVFRDMEDDEIWWPRNSRSTMTRLAEEAGWTVKKPDMGLLERDSMILLTHP